MHNTVPSGVGVALITPFNHDQSIDYDGLSKLLELCIQGGVDYFVVNGTTAENPALTIEERYALLDFVLKKNAGRLPIVFGIGGNNTKAVTQEVSDFKVEGVCAILSASPYYNKPSQDGIYAHYSEIASATELPIILYNVPGRTSSNISSETTLRLANKFKNIVAIKEASGDLDQITEIILRRPPEFKIISGDDNLTFHMLALGCDGVISVSGQGVPEIFCKVFDEYIKSNWAASKEAHLSLFHLTNLLFKEGNPAGVKALLELRGLCKNVVRLPLIPATDELKGSIKSELIALDLI
ncbi:MAG: 4-hydroxy-tetrahydrodipicolinate synthase [Flavobacteriales bacterium]|jgi:4-hydroxy-tetrahydrodipicolinate synthase|nr:4-hydroxy-tetrahydrodipicolinate synthase [Flavobacteriales bacterium]|tara:strand:- start:3460 stop:4350 length:891 start_codon:yes stop_codon:yes gene_type:complete